MQRRKREYATIWLGCEPPQEGWCKLNTDGCWKRNQVVAGGGGVIRDDKGNWMGGFAIKMGACSETEAKVWAVIHGLRYAWDRGIGSLMPHLLCNWKENKNDGGSQYSNLLDGYGRLLEREWQVSVQHVYWETN